MTRRIPEHLNDHGHVLRIVDDSPQRRLIAQAGIGSTQEALRGIRIALKSQNRSRPHLVDPLPRGNSLRCRLSKSLEDVGCEELNIPRREHVS